MSDEEVRSLLDTSAGSPEIREAVLRMREAGNAGETRTPSGNTYAEIGKALPAAPSSAGTLIGRYLLMEKLGEGGMGEVWLAEQQEPVRRRVALKLIKAGMNSREVIRRFESERQALALMDHPDIARVFDAGSTPEGVPYFVMEYASGEPITGYCDGRQLSTRQRLELFRQLCEAVQHAHQKAIIHRDLKPSNILVTEVDGRPMPKIIDFGIAKALGENLTGEMIVTRIGALIGTPEYVSPEQALSSGEDIDTRTDIYSLGVVFYELLAGVRPIELSKIPLAEFLKRLREDDPPKPSTRVTTQDPTTSGEVARKRQTEAATLAKLLNGDLDAIALKALEKDRSRRYSTPMEFAADIERYLHNQPVLAHTAGASYRIGKYVRRHGFAVSAGLAAVVLLVGFAVVQAAQLRRITRERDRANRVTDFITRMFKVSDPSEARGATITAREILDQSSKEIESGLAKDPEVQAQMMHVMGDVYYGLGLWSRADSLSRRAVDIRRRVLGPTDPDTLQSMNLLALVLYDQSQATEAEKVCRETLDARRRVLGPDHRDTLESARMLGNILTEQGRYKEAEAIHRQVAETAARVFGSDDKFTVRGMSSLGIDLDYQGRHAEAEKIFRDVLERDRRIYGPDHPTVFDDMINLGASAELLHHFAEAEKINSDVLQAQQRVLGAEHPDTLLSMGNLALVLSKEDHNPQAEKLFRDALAIKLRVLGPEHRSTLVTMGNLADVLTAQGKYVEAERLVRQTLVTERRVLGPDHSDTLTTLQGLGELLADEKRYAEAEKTDRETLETRRRILGDAHQDTALSAYELAEVLAVQGKSEDALNNLQFALEHDLRSDVRSDLGKDEAYKSIHGNPRFEALLAASNVQGATAKK